MNYSVIKEYDIANGPGVRLTLFVSGCSHHCKSCFQPETWDPAYGQAFTEDTENFIVNELKAASYQGITLLGGEPFEPYNQPALLHLLTRIRKECPGKDVWAFTGYLLDEMLLAEETIPAAGENSDNDRKKNSLPGRKMQVTEDTAPLLRQIDVLVDGPFVEEQKDITLLFKGSANQRTIDLPRSFEAGRIEIWKPVCVSISATSHL